MTTNFRIKAISYSSPTFILGLLLLLNLILKSIFINAFPLSGDEPFTVFLAQYSFPDLYDVLVVENNPPLFYLITHYWVKVVGISAPLVRIPSLIFSVLTVVYIFLIGEKFYTTRVAILASLLYTFSSMQMLFSHEIRVYSLFALLTAGAMYYFMICTLQHSASTKYYFLLTLFNTLLIYAHFFGFFLLFIQGLCFLLFSIQSKKFDKKIIYSYITLIILYTPYLSILFSRLYLTSSNGTWLNSPKTPMALYFMLVKFFNMPLMALLVLSFFAFSIFIFIKNKEKANRNSLIIIAWAIIPHFLMYFISLKTPMYLDRYLVFVSIGSYLCFAIAVAYCLNSFSNKINYAAIAVLTFIMIVTMNPTKEKEKRSITEYVTKIKELKIKNKNLIVILAPSWSYYLFAHEYDLRYFKDYKNTKSLLAKDNIFIVNNLYDIKPEILANKPSIALVDEWASLSDPNGSLDNYIKELNRPIQQFQYGIIKITYVP